MTTRQHIKKQRHHFADKGKESLPGPAGVQKRRPLLHEVFLLADQYREDPGRSRAGPGDCPSHLPFHYAHLWVLGSCRPQGDNYRFTFCKNEPGFLDFGPTRARPTFYALLSSGLRPGLRGAHGSRECCAQKS